MKTKILIALLSIGLVGATAFSVLRTSTKHSKGSLEDDFFMNFFGESAEQSGLNYDFAPLLPQSESMEGLSGEVSGSGNVAPARPVAPIVQEEPEEDLSVIAHKQAEQKCLKKVKLKKSKKAKTQARNQKTYDKKLKRCIGKEEKKIMKEITDAIKAAGGGSANGAVQNTGSADGSQNFSNSGGSVQNNAPRGGNDQLSQLLTSSAWCSLSVSNSGRNSSTQRYQFFSNGSCSDSSQSESSYAPTEGGYIGGTYDSSSMQSGSCTWSVQGDTLVINGSSVPVQVTRNSSGYPIINAYGTEFSMCE